jgi:hypothetical protein
MFGRTGVKMRLTDETWRQKDKLRGKCDYCHKRRLVGRKTKFCDECYYEWNRVVDKYMDGDPFWPLKAAAVETGIPLPAAIEMGVPVCACGNLVEYEMNNGKCFTCNGGRPE